MQNAGQINLFIPGPSQGRGFFFFRTLSSPGLHDGPTIVGTGMTALEARKTNRPIFPSGQGTAERPVGFEGSRVALASPGNPIPAIPRDQVPLAGSLSGTITSGAKPTD